MKFCTPSPPPPFFQILDRALEECGDDLDSAIRSLNELRLGSAAKNLGSVAGKSDLAADADAQGMLVLCAKMFWINGMPFNYLCLYMIIDWVWCVF